MSLAAVIVHFGNPHPTQRLIEVLRSCPAVSRTIVVLHDSYPLHRVKEVEWVEKENRGYAAGLNRAVEHILANPGDVHVILALNPDVQVDSKTIEKLYAEQEAQHADCLFPVLQENGRLTYGYRFSRFGSLLSSMDPEWYSGACFIFSIQAWEQTGGFDESYFHYFEDRDFCLRLRRAGLRFHQASEIIIEHAGKSGADYPASELPKFAVRSHLMALERSKLLGPVSFLNVTARHILYLFRWKRGWRGIPKWLKGIEEFVTGTVVE